jgi:serralysin
MATVTLAPAIGDYQYWADFFEPSAFNVTSKSASTYNYTRADGTRISITGSGFSYDPTAPKEFLGGTISSITVRNAANIVVLTITGLAYDAVDFYHRVNGFPGESGNGFDAISQLLLGNDVVNGTEHGDDISAGSQRGNDTINAKGGDDFVKGDQGNDTIDGGTGWDQLSYEETIWGGSGAFKGINLNTATGVVIDSWNNTDHIKNFEEYRGSSFADKITGSADDALFHGLRGADVIDGGAGWDQVCYEVDQRYGGLKGIVANLATGKVIDGYGQTDTVIGIEAVRGTKFNDSFVGSGGDNGFLGLGGKDSFNGGAGFDTLEFQNIDWNGAVHGVTVNLALAANQVVNDGFNQVETAVSIEGAIGSKFADTLTGNAVGNWFDPRGGKDTMTGGGANDTFRFKNAEHSVVGANADVIQDFDDLGDDKIDLGSVFGGVLVYKSNAAFNGAGQVRVAAAGADVLVEVNVGGTLAADMQIRLVNTTFASMASTDFVL